MNERVRIYLLWAWTIVLLVSVLGFAWRGAAPASASFFAPMSAAEAEMFRAVNWLGAVVALGFAGLPWFPRAREIA